ncbi:MAG: hypothetical protein ACRDDF_11055, partial [Aeromonas sp.]
MKMNKSLSYNTSLSLKNQRILGMLIKRLALNLCGPYKTISCILADVLGEMNTNMFEAIVKKYLIQLL